MHIISRIGNEHQLLESFSSALPVIANILQNQQQMLMDYELQLQLQQNMSQKQVDENSDLKNIIHQQQDTLNKLQQW